MPGNPRAMLHKSRIDEEQLRIESEIRALEQSMKYSKPRLNTKMAECVQTIYDEFEAVDVASGKISKLPATQFDYLRARYSPPTLIKAKKILGVKSSRKGKLWFWSHPKFAPTEAMQQTLQRKLSTISEADDEIRKINRQAAVSLMELVKASSYFIQNLEAIRQMALQGYTEKTTKRMKSDLKIVSVKVEDLWYWIWAPQEVQDYLITKLAAGPVPYTQIFIEAFADHNWNEYVMKIAMKAIGSIQWKIYNGIGYWVDINSPGHEPAPSSFVEKQVKEYNASLPRVSESKSYIKPVAAGVNRPELETDNEEVDIGPENFIEHPVPGVNIKMASDIVEEDYGDIMADIDDEFPDVDEPLSVRQSGNSLIIGEDE